MKFLSTLAIRPLGPRDAETFLHVHHAAVHNTARPDYAPDVLDAWSGPVTDERVQKYMSSADEEVRIGAFDGDTMAGLGCVAPLKSELRACYVHPDYGRMGVGSRLVEGLETIAAGMGLDHLTLDSSLTAEHFYTQLGYRVIERGSHRLSDGSFMPAIKMRKDLVPLGDLAGLKKRSAKADADKAWENSWTRRGLVAGIAYVVFASWLALIGVTHNYLHALVPVCGYLLTMAALPMLKTYWIEKIYRRDHAL